MFLCPAFGAAQVVTTYTRLPSANSTEAPKYKLSGIVVNSATGEPIRHALVSFFSGQQRSMMTDTDGRFEFDGIPQSNVALAAQRPGFFNDNELSDGRKPPRVFDVGPDRRPVTIRLTPESVVFGRLVDSDGLPIPRLIVRTLTQRIQEGRRTWQQAMAASTDEDGRFRIFGLRPGNYILSAGPGQMPALVTTGGDPLELGYPEVTYPGGGSDASPAMMRINPGQQLEVNLTVRAEPFYTVSGSVGGGDQGQQLGVQLMSNSLVPQMEFSARVDPETRTFQFPRVSRGDYKLMVWGSDSAGKPFTSSMPIQVRGNVMGVHLEAQPTLNIPVRLRVERTRETQAVSIPNNYVPIQLQNVEDENQRFFLVREDPKNPSSPMMFQNVLPGTYRAIVEPWVNDLYVASARFGTTDLLHEEMTLTQSARQGQIDVVERDDTATLNINFPSPTRVSSVDLVFVPDDGTPYAWSNLPWTQDQQVGRPLRPGSYVVLAFYDLDLEYSKREALEPYLSKGVRVTLAPGEQKTVSPEIIHRDHE
jgi:hypothetical protein